MSNDSLDTSERPNVILIYTDQQRFDALSANGNERVGTPNLDALASEGGGSASPTSPHRSVRRRGRGCSLRGTATPTRATRTTIRSRRRSRTPRCSYVKVGTGPRRSDAFDWRKTASHLAIHAPEDDWDRRVNESRSGRMQEPFADDTIPADRSITARVFGWANEYLDHAAGRDEPFFFWLSVPDPYASMDDEVDVPLPVWREAEAANKPYKRQLLVELDGLGRSYPTDEDTLRMKRRYYGMVTHIDDHVGRLLQSLRDRARRRRARCATRGGVGRAKAGALGG